MHSNCPPVRGGGIEPDWGCPRSRGAQGGEARSYRLAWLLTLAVIAILGAWSAILLTLGFTPLSGLVYLLQLAAIVALPGLCLACVWFLAAGPGGHRGAASIGLRGLILLAAVCMLRSPWHST